MADCERCRGTGFEISSVPGPDGKDVEVARRCTCQVADPAHAADRLLQSLRIPPRYEHCTFLTFEIGEGSTSLTKDARYMVMRYCGGYAERGAESVAVLRELAETHGVRGQFWDYHELMREIRNSYNPATALTEYELLEPIIELEVLLLDDLGAWKMTDWMNDTLFYILNRRYLARRPTLITTNYPDRDVSPRDLEKADATVRREYLVDRIGYRLRSRLLEACTVVRLDGPDRRQVALQASNQRLLL